MKDLSFYDKEKSKQEKLKHKEYLKDVKQARKYLVTIAKEYYPYDFQYTLDLFMQGIQHMREYYARGYCVVAKEIEGMPTRLDMCDEIIAAYVEYIVCINREKEAEAWNNFCDTVKKYLLYLWD